MERVLIQNGILVYGGREQKADLLIENGRIIQKEPELMLGSLLRRAETLVLDAGGCYVFPGFIDAHTHLDMDAGAIHTADDFTSGTRAALVGGTTSIIDFATQEKGQTLQEALDIWHTKAEHKSSCNYGFHMAITDCNADISSQLQAIAERGVSSCKVYMAYDALRLSDTEIFEILTEAKQLGILVGCHCENGDMVNRLIAEQLANHHKRPSAHPASRPPAVEAEAVSRFLALAQLADVPVHIVHLSTKQGLEQVKLARKRGQHFFAETCPQYLTLSDSSYRKSGFEGAKFVCSPPLRKKPDIKALWRELSRSNPVLDTGAKDNSFIQTIATDHCSFNFKGQKEIGKNNFSKIPNGLPGLQHRPALIFTAGNVGAHTQEKLPRGSIQLTPAQFSALMSENAAKIFGMFPERGSLECGSIADITVWNPLYKSCISAKTSLHNADYTPYEGMEIYGRAEYVILGGKLCVKNGSILCENEGNYLFRKTGFSN